MISSRTRPVSEVAQALRAKYCLAPQPCPLIDDQISNLRFFEQVLWTSTIQDQADQAAQPRSEIAAKLTMGLVTIWYGLESGALLRIDSLTSGLDSNLPNRVWSDTPSAPAYSCTRTFFEPCEDRIVSIDTLSPAEFRMEIDELGAEFPPLDGRSRDGYAFTNALGNFNFGNFDFGNIMGDGGISQFNNFAKLDVVVGNPFTGSANALASFAVPNNSREDEDLLVMVGRDVWSPDVIAHEYAHHLQIPHVGQTRSLEQGAVREAIADLLGAAVFPAADGTWRIGPPSGIGVGPIRNMKEPRDPLVQSGIGSVDRYQDKGRCDPRLTYLGCQYEWSGIPSRALALLADGPPGARRAALGRVATWGLVLESMRSHQSSWHLEESDRILNFRMKLERTCRASIGTSNPRWARGRGLITAADCEMVGLAFDAVGVPSGYTSGFSRYGSIPAGTVTRTEWAGRRLMNGCVLAGHSINAELRDEKNSIRVLVSRSATDTPPLTIDLSGGEVRVAVKRRCGGASVANCQDVGVWIGC